MSLVVPDLPPSLRFLAGGGEASRRILAHDWSAHPLGSPDAWPEALRVALGIVLNSLEAMILAWGPEFHFFSNDGYAPLLGANAAHATGGRLDEAWRPIWAEAKPILDAALAGRATRHVDLARELFTTDDAAESWWTVSCSRVPGADGAPAGLLIVLHETTDHVRGRAAERRNRQIIDSATDHAVIATDLDGRVTRWSEGARRVLGWTEAEMLGRSTHRMFTPEDVAAGRPEHEMQCSLETGSAADERWHLRRNGERFWANGEMTVLRDEGGAAAGYVKVLRDRTEQRLAAERLRDTAAELERAQEAGGVGVFSVDAEGVLRGSPHFQRLFGVPDADAADVRAYERLVVPEDIGLTSTLAGRASLDVPPETEYRIRRADTGELRWISRRGKAERDAAGRLVRFAGVARDITDRVAAQQAVEATEAQFRTLAQALPNQVWTARPDGFIDWLNERVVEYGGQSSETLVEAGWMTIVHPDDRVEAGLRWAAALASGEDYETEFRIRRHDGAHRWHLVRGLPIRDEEGRIVRWVGTNTDVHDRRSAADQTRQDRDRLWQLSGDLMLVCDFAGRINAVNPSATRLLGWLPEEMVGHGVDEFIHPDDLAATSAEIGVLESGVSTLAFENRYRRKEGGYRRLQWSAVPEAGRVHAVGRDITAEVEAAEQLRAAEDALRQSQKMEAVGQLTGGIAHDFNNLLQGITGSLEIIQRRVAQGRTGEIDRFIAGATTAANRAAALTHRLLAFSRRQPLDPRPVRVNPLVSSMEDLLRRTIGERIELELVLGGGLWLTLCDPNQLENALLNLAINARDAMPEGGRLTIETANAHLDAAYAGGLQGVRPGQYVCLAVTDTGTGMDADTIVKAFEPFFTTKPIGQGTGLGLSMIYGFARQSEGHAKIYSEPGHGTTFKLYLPRHRGAADAEEQALARAFQPAADAGEVVLVVEDEPVVRGLIAETLAELGYRALEAADGPEGLAVLQSKRRIDLLITDIGLPGINGRQVADAGRALRPELKVLFMTGYAENAALASGFLEPGMAMITKPFAMDALATRIRGIIEGREAR